jgi:hypothetical protein
MISNERKEREHDIKRVEDMNPHKIKPQYPGIKKQFNPALVREVHIETHVANAVKELTALLLSKHRDYGPKNISLAPGGAVNGLRVRMHDKLARINNLVDSGLDPQHESLEDSFKDMANYAIIGLLVLRGQWDSE